MTGYTDREIADRISDAQGHQARRVAQNIHGTTPSTPGPPVSMDDHLHLFQEARQTRMGASIGGEVTERLRPYVRVLDAEAQYALALREALPATYPDADAAMWAARGKRTELLKGHNYSTGRTTDVMESVAGELRTAAERLASTPTTRTKAAEATPARRVVRVTEQLRPSNYPSL